MDPRLCQTLSRAAEITNEETENKLTLSRRRYSSGSYAVKEEAQNDFEKEKFYYKPCWKFWSNCTTGMMLRYNYVNFTEVCGI